MNILFWVCTGLTAAGLTIFLLQIIAVRKMLTPPQEEPSCGANFPPISVLKPLKGIDDNLYDNLDSFCRQSYPAYEVIFSLQDHNDPAYKLACKIKEKYPDREIRIVIEPYTRGMNPKVNNLIPAYQASRYDIILISDSNVLVGPDYLRSIGRHLSDPSVGLVTNLIRGTGARTLGSLFENLHLNSFIVGSVCFLDRYLRMPCVIGKSMLMRKKDLEAIGGLESVKNVLAEDFIIGREVHRSGKRVVVSGYLINNVNQYWGLSRFLNRHTRWAKLRWKIGGARYVSEILTNAVFISCLPLLVAGPSTATVALACAAASVKAAGDRHLGIRTGTVMRAPAYLLAPLKDILIGLLWFVPLLSDRVAWRGNRYRIDRDSRLAPAPENGLWSLPYRIADAIRERSV